jgi:hypothetical protein
MAHDISLPAMQSLRLNLVQASASRMHQQVQQAEALMIAPGASGFAQSMPFGTFALASSNQWSGSEIPSPSYMMNHSLLSLPVHGMESHGMRGDICISDSPIVQYLYQQKSLQRQCAHQYHHENGRRGQSDFTSPLHVTSPELVAPHAMYALLPAVLSRSTDGVVLTKFQIFLRLHMEAFAANNKDVSSRVRGRHKQVTLHQVGIRCRHCAHISASQRTKGAVYFPKSTMGIYQAAQNMCTTHLQCGLCPEMPESTKTMFAQLIGTKTAASSSAGGRAYWGRCAQQMGLVDTEKGIFPVGAIPEGIVPL